MGDFQTETERRKKAETVVVWGCNSFSHRAHRLWRRQYLCGTNRFKYVRLFINHGRIRPKNDKKRQRQCARSG